MGWATSSIAVTVLRFSITHIGSSSGGDAEAKQWAAKIMDAPFGRWALGIAGIALMIAGACQLYDAWESKLSRRLHLVSIGIVAYGIYAIVKARYRTIRAT